MARKTLAILSCSLGMMFAVHTASAISSTSEHVVVNIKEQRLYLYRDGLPTFTTELSTGRRSLPTPRGEFYVSEKDAHHISSVYHCAMHYYLRLSGEPFGIHYGRNPGYPASHGCIRVGKIQDAVYLFQVVPAGTTVTIE
jgi:lipoprotein-anchoring transpeptidase ErfK/SrfK